MNDLITDIIEGMFCWGIFRQSTWKINRNKENRKFLSYEIQIKRKVKIKYNYLQNNDPLFIYLGYNTLYTQNKFQTIMEVWVNINLLLISHNIGIK